MCEDFIFNSDLFRGSILRMLFKEMRVLLIKFCSFLSQRPAASELLDNVMRVPSISACCPGWLVGCRFLRMGLLSFFYF